MSSLNFVFTSCMGSWGKMEMLKQNCSRILDLLMLYLQKISYICLSKHVKINLQNLTKEIEKYNFESSDNALVTGKNSTHLFVYVDCC